MPLWRFEASDFEAGSGNAAVRFLEKHRWSTGLTICVLLHSAKIKVSESLTASTVTTRTDHVYSAVFLAPQRTIYQDALS